MLKKKIILSVSLFLCSIIALTQSKTITGKVSSTDGAQLSGATVQLKNSKTTTRTGNDGTYSISVPANTAGILAFTYVGFETNEVIIGNSTAVDVTLAEVAKGFK